MPELVLSTLTILFVTIGLLGVATVFLVVRPITSNDARRRIAIIATVVGVAVLLLFALAGNTILGLMG